MGFLSFFKFHYCFALRSVSGINFTLDYFVDCNFNFPFHIWIIDCNRGSWGLVEHLWCSGAEWHFVNYWKLHIVKILWLKIFMTKYLKTRKTEIAPNWNWGQFFFLNLFYYINYLFILTSFKWLNGIWVYIYLATCTYSISAYHQSWLPVWLNLFVVRHYLITTSIWCKVYQWLVTSMVSSDYLGNR